jgi:hypothetical protein
MSWFPNLFTSSQKNTPSPKLDEKKDDTIDVNTEKQVVNKKNEENGEQNIRKVESVKPAPAPAPAPAPTDKKPVENRTVEKPWYQIWGGKKRKSKKKKVAAKKAKKTKKRRRSSRKNKK